MHDCADSIPLRDPRQPVWPWASLTGALAVWFGLLFLLPYLAYGAWGRRGILVALGFELLFFIFFVRPLFARLWPVVRVNRAARAGLIPGPSLAATLCPHGVRLNNAADHGRLIAWSGIADLEVVRAGRHPVVITRLARAGDRPSGVVWQAEEAARTGLPPAARFVGHSDLPGDPAWLWLGFTGRNQAEHIRDVVEAWRAQ